MKRSTIRAIEVARTLNPNVVGEHAVEIANQLADAVQRMAEAIKNGIANRASADTELCLHCSVVTTIEDFYVRQNPGEEEINIPVHDIIEALGQTIGETLAQIADPAAREKSLENTLIFIRQQVQEALTAGLIHPEHETKQ